MLSDITVCFIAGCLSQGGAERQLYYMARSLHQNGNRVTILSLTRGEYWERRLQAQGIPVIWVGEQQSNIVRLMRITSELRRLRPDIVHSQHAFTNPYAMASARLAGIREAGSLRNDAVSEITGEKKFIRKACLRLLKLIVANSRAAITNVQQMGIPASRLRFLPNVVDTDEFRPPSPLRSSSPVHVVAAGRLVRQKRFDRLLSILDMVRRRTDERFTASIVGDGPLKSSLEAQIRDLGLQDIVKLTGASAGMPDVYRSADVLVLTSDHEGTPNVVLEAMATGIPVVSTRVGGVADIVEDGRRGFLLSPDDDAGFAASLSSLISSYDLRRHIGDSARAYIEHNHSAAKLPEYLATVYSACA